MKVTIATNTSIVDTEMKSILRGNVTLGQGGRGGKEHDSMYERLTKDASLNFSSERERLWVVVVKISGVTNGGIVDGTSIKRPSLDV